MRRGEFAKNYKKDYQKMLELIQEYCIVTKIKLSFCNTTTSGSKQTLFCTSGQSMKDNLIAIFNSKQTADLIPIKNEGVTEYSEDSVNELTQQDVDTLNTNKFRIEGFISKVESGRNSKDRQFFYVNSRPVELDEMKKVVNETFRKFNPKQFPFVAMNLRLEQNECDVNLSKDKRTIALNNFRVLQLAVKKALLLTFGVAPSKLELSSINQSVKNRKSGNFAAEENNDDSSDDDKIALAKPGHNFANVLMQWKKTPHDPAAAVSSQEPRKRKLTNEILRLQKEIKIDSFFVRAEKKQVEVVSDEDEDKSRPTSETQVDKSDLMANLMEVDDENTSRPLNCRIEIIEPRNVKKDSTSFAGKPQTETINAPTNSSKMQVDDSECSIIDDPNESKKNDSFSCTISCKVDPSRQLATDKTVIEIIDLDNEVDSRILNNSNQKRLANKKSTGSKIKLTLDSIKQCIDRETKAKREIADAKKQRKLQILFKESVNSTKAESELKTEIKKEMFTDMKILGQFNLGFIITKLDSNLFIVDQHASDEKSNFEKFRKTSKFQPQPLVIAESLNLNAIQEICIEENLPVFEKFGFRFHIDNTQEIGRRVKLTGKPNKGSWDFGVNDIEEIICMLEAHTDLELIEPQKVRKMFASKACRKSVMIGTALTKQKMKEIVSQMAALDHPWVSLNF